MKALSFLFKLFNLDGDDPRISDEYQLEETKSDGGIILPQISRRKFLGGIGAVAVTAAVGKSFSFPTIIPRTRWDHFHLVPVSLMHPIEYSRLGLKKECNG